MEASKKLRILCLHGYHQNKDIFRQKTGSFRKPLKKIAEFEFMDAPHLLAESFQEPTLDSAYHQKALVESNPDGRGWWLKNLDGKESLQESLKAFEQFLESNEPFDGIIGFSQGAAFLGLVCILLGEKYFPSSFKFVILVAGFKSLIPSHKVYYEIENKIGIPSLHIIGDSDEVISADRSRDLVQLFNNAQVVSHSGGHYVPATKEVREVYKQYIEQFISCQI